MHPVCAQEIQAYARLRADLSALVSVRQEMCCNERKETNDNAEAAHCSNDCDAWHCAIANKVVWVLYSAQISGLWRMSILGGECL